VVILEAEMHIGVQPPADIGFVTPIVPARINGIQVSGPNIFKG
jgi:hypothetical protein